ncbi:hypothetical protein FN846DRAFT_529741 [Sphaerosporella brunnea]|uniref:Uncharacterized protein n=1 Tax=Sphaerosporella brunnea TaxID=1250544 RepID=A0A5J5EF97_9PEZI|nr:hypothetical protein FN846DRAFT_529741 [Sphaerosporella brunnea]
MRGGVGRRPNPEEPGLRTVESHHRLVDHVFSHQKDTRFLQGGQSMFGVPEQKQADSPGTRQDKTARKARMCCESLGRITRDTIDPSVHPVRDTDLPAFEVLIKLLARHGRSLHQCGARDPAIRSYEKQMKRKLRIILFVADHSYDDQLITLYNVLLVDKKNGLHVYNTVMDAYGLCMWARRSVKE